MNPSDERALMIEAQAHIAKAIDLAQRADHDQFADGLEYWEAQFLTRIDRLTAQIDGDRDV